jgi:putative inorganic carbon (hco3(-)) transporter
MINLNHFLAQAHDAAGTFRQSKFARQMVQPRLLFGVPVIIIIAVVAGYLSVLMGEFSVSRPIFVVALPLLIAIGFTFALSPKALVLAIIVLRAGADPVFQNARFEGQGGLGGLVNLAVIVLALILVARNPDRVPRAAWWAWIPFMTMQFIGVTYSPDPFQSLRLVLGQLSTFAMFLLAFHLVDDFKSFDKALRLVVLSSIPVAALTILAIVRGETFMALDGLETVSGRYSGPFSHPNILAFYLVSIISTLFYQGKRKRGEGYSSINLIPIAYMLVLLGLLYATKTRSAWVAAAFLFLLYGIFAERRYLIYLVAAPALAMFIPEFRDRILDLGQGNELVTYGTLNSFAWRKLIWTTGLSWMEPSHYFAGYGGRGFVTKSVIFFPLAGGKEWGAHSVFVQIFFDLGVIGLFSFIWLFWATFRQMLPAFRKESILGIIFGSTLGSYLIVAYSDNMLDYLVFNWYFWFLMGAVCAIVGTQGRANVDHA